MKAENGYFRCDKCGKLMYDRTKYTTVKRYKTVKSDNYYTKESRVGRPLHFHDKCLNEILSYPYCSMERWEPYE